MAITWSDVEALAPELSTVPVARQNLILAMVEKQVDGDVWTEFTDDGKRFLAAHLGTMTSSGSAAAGPITSESLGPMMRSYGWSGEYGALASTRYGLEYKRLMKIALGVAAVVP
jgi:hypothetical protein